MSKIDVTIYISDECSTCKNLLTQMKEWNIAYETKNVSKNNGHLEELQRLGVFGTPATFIKNNDYAILGFQKQKIKYSLDIGNGNWGN